MPTLVTSPLAGSGTRQIWLARVTATSRKLSSGSTTMPFGLGMVLTKQVEPSLRRQLPDPAGRVMHAGLALVGEVEVADGAKTRSFTPLKLSLAAVSRKGVTAPLAGSRSIIPRL